MPGKIKTPSNPFRALMARDPNCGARMRRALDPERPALLRAGAFLALAGAPPAEAKACKLLYAEGIRFLAGPQGRGLDAELSEALRRGLRVFARVFLAYLRQAPMKGERS